LKSNSNTYNNSIINPLLLRLRTLVSPGTVGLSPSVTNRKGEYGGERESKREREVLLPFSSRHQPKKRESDYKEERVSQWEREREFRDERKKVGRREKRW